MDEDMNLCLKQRVILKISTINTEIILTCDPTKQVFFNIAFPLNI